MRGKTTTAKQIVTNHDANRVVLDVRTLRRRIERLEEKAEDAAQRARERMVGQTAPLREQEAHLVAVLQLYYGMHRKNGQKSIKLQDGIIGMRIVPRVEVPKDAVDRAPEAAVTIKKKLNKTALKALGPDALAQAGGRIVRPTKFYVAPADEDAEK